MAYNNYYPATYQPLYPTTYQQQQQPVQPTQPMPQTSNSITWVQGEVGAKAHPLAPASSVMLLDSEGDYFYIKSTDASGMPMPLRTFEYKEVIPTAEADTRHSHDAPQMDMSGFAKTEDLEEIKRLLDELSKQIAKKEGKTNGK